MRAFERVRSAVTWLGTLMLAAMSQSCATESLSDWADERFPLSEVLGIIEDKPAGHVLLIRVTGGSEPPAGFYELAVDKGIVQGGEPSARAPTRMSPSEADAIRSLLENGPERPRLSSRNEENYGEFVEQFERTESGLRRVDRPESRYYALISDLIEAPGGGEIPRIALYSLRADGARELRGTACLPSAKLNRGRRALAIAAVPITWAVEIVAYPIQIVGTVLVVFGFFLG